MNDPLQNWLSALAGYLEASVVVAGKGASRIEGTSESWQRFFEDIAAPKEKQHALLIASEPHDRDQWCDHLRVVERAAARQLTSAPVGFTALIPAASRKRATKTVVRFAFGLSLSMGRRLRQRFTSYVHDGKGAPLLQTGSDALFSLHPDIGPLDVKRKDLGNALPALLSAAAEAQETYRKDPRVIEEIERLRKNYEQEYQSLDTLYTINSGQDARLLGTRSTDLRNEDATEAEYVGRLEDLTDRYRPRVILEPLTLGIIDGWHDAARV
jgi:hypothetical protein